MRYVCFLWNRLVIVRLKRKKKKISHYFRCVLDFIIKSVFSFKKRTSPEEEELKIEQNCELEWNGVSFCRFQQRWLDNGADLRVRQTQQFSMIIYNIFANGVDTSV